MTESYVKLNAEKKYLYGVLQAAPRPESLKTPRKFVFFVLCVPLDPPSVSLAHSLALGPSYA